MCKIELKECSIEINEAEEPKLIPSSNFLDAPNGISLVSTVVLSNIEAILTTAQEWLKVTLSIVQFQDLGDNVKRERNVSVAFQ